MDKNTSPGLESPALVNGKSRRTGRRRAILKILSMIIQWLRARKHRRYLKKALADLDGAEAYVRCLRLIRERGYNVEIVVVVDGVICPSSLMTNSRDKSGGIVIDFLLQAAIGERLRLNSVFTYAVSAAVHGEPELTQKGL